MKNVLLSAAGILWAIGSTSPAFADCIFLVREGDSRVWVNRCTEPMGVSYEATGSQCGALPTGGLTPFEGRKGAAHLKQCAVEWRECTRAYWMQNGGCGSP